MKILLITKLYPGYNNQPRSEISYALHYFVKDWIKQGHDVQIIRTWPQYPGAFKFLNKRRIEDDTFVFENVTIHRVTINKIPKVNYLQSDINKTYKKIKNNIIEWGKPDVILCHMHNPNVFLAEKLKKDFEVPLILTMHKTDINNLLNIKTRLLKFKKTLYSIDEIGFRSQVLYDRFQKLNLRNNSGFIVPSGIDKSIIISENDIDEIKDLKVKSFFIAANLNKQKNVTELIKAFAIVSKNNNKIELNIAGTGPEEKNIKKLITKLNMNDKINMLGYLERDLVLKKMKISDVFVMVSVNETFGLVYLEAMANGCVTIGSKGEGIDGVIKNGINGYLCEPGNINELVNILKEILSLSEQKIYNIKLNSIQTAREMSQNNISEYYIERIQKVIESIDNI